MTTVNRIYQFQRATPAVLRFRQFGQHHFNMDGGRIIDLLARYYTQDEITGPFPDGLANSKRNSYYAGFMITSNTKLRM
jgi:hypothetical protein